MSQNARLTIPPGFVRNHPSVSAVMEADAAGEYLLRAMEEKTGIPLVDADILDVGCESRFASAIINNSIAVGSYTGIDVFKEMVDYLAA